MIKIIVNDTHRLEVFNIVESAQNEKKTLQIVCNAPDNAAHLKDLLKSKITSIKILNYDTEETVFVYDNYTIVDSIIYQSNTIVDDGNTYNGIMTTILLK